MLTKEEIEFIAGTDKPFFIDTLRALFLKYDKEEISLSKVVEELNITAFHWHEKRNKEANQILKALAEWSERWPRAKFYNSTAKMDAELIEIEERAKRYKNDYSL